MTTFDSAAIDYVTIVSGLPRSGTSMMMQMLAAGGLPSWTDEVRIADDDNPRGYLECERVKGLAHDNQWLAEARGHAVKIVAPLLHYVRPGNHRVIFMQRDMSEVLRSQARMLQSRGKAGSRLTSEQLAGVFEKQLQRAKKYLQDGNGEVLFVQYACCVGDPNSMARLVNRFLSGILCETQMALAVDHNLYRERS
jgi:hypothetical protein